MIRTLILVALLVSVVACAPKAAVTAAVAIDQFQFSPSVLEIPVGTTVTWTNRDDILHTVTSGTTHVAGLGVYDASADGQFDGRMDGADRVFSFTFDRPGTYAYFCDRHRHMTATVVVR